MTMITPFKSLKDHCRRIRALTNKEFYQIIRDPSSLLISFVFPCVLLFIYAFGVSLDLDHLPIGVVMEETSPDAMDFATMLAQSPDLQVQFARDRRELDEALLAGTIRGIVIIPSTFSEWRKTPERKAPIEVIGDGSEPNTSQFVKNYVQLAWQSWLQKLISSEHLEGTPLVQADTRFWYNPAVESRNFLLPGSLGIIMTMIGTLLTALVMSREWERGTMESLLTTPMTPFEILASKMLAYYVLGLSSMALCVFLVHNVYGVPLQGSLFALTVVTIAYLFPALSLGLMVSSLVRNQQVAAQMCIFLAFAPSFLLSGFLFEITSMPIPIQIITNFIPARYFVACLQTIFLVGDIWTLFLRNMIPLVLLGIFFFGISWRKTRRQLE